DDLVTGVQTCALPIYPVLLRRQLRGRAVAGAGAPAEPAADRALGRARLRRRGALRAHLVFAVPAAARRHAAWLTAGPVVGGRRQIGRASWREGGWCRM